jgi:hypothetical protein
MNPQTEIMKGKVGLDKHLEKFRYELRQFAEAHKVVNVSTSYDPQDGMMFATFLYEKIDNL